MITKSCKHCNSEHPLTEEHWRFLPRGYTCRIKHRQDKLAWYARTREKRLEVAAAYRKVTINKKKEYDKAYGKTPQYKEYQRNYHYTRRHSDVEYKIRTNIRSRLKDAMRAKVLTRTNKLLGCTIGEFRVYLEGKFLPGMTWDNYGKTWHIDHVFPLSKVNLFDEIELLKVTNYTNLQPLWALDNIRKSNKT